MSKSLPAFGFGQEYAVEPPPIIRLDQAEQIGKGRFGVFGVEFVRRRHLAKV